MPALIPFVPLLAAGVGAGVSLWQGNRAEQQNRAANDQANRATAAQQALIQQLMSGISPEAYRAQAAQAGQSALSQLAANFAGRGMLSSGALHTAGAQTLSQLYTDADARYNQDRMNAFGMALGGQQAIQRQYAGQVNPSPYDGLGAALGAVGMAGGQYFYNRQATPAPGYGTPLPGFGVRYGG